MGETICDVCGKTLEKYNDGHGNTRIKPCPHCRSTLTEEIENLCRGLRRKTATYLVQIEGFVSGKFHKVPDELPCEKNNCPTCKGGKGEK